MTTKRTAPEIDLESKFKLKRSILKDRVNWRYIRTDDI